MWAVLIDGQAIGTTTAEPSRQALRTLQARVRAAGQAGVIVRAEPADEGGDVLLSPLPDGVRVPTWLDVTPRAVVVQPRNRRRGPKLRSDTHSRRVLGVRLTESELSRLQAAATADGVDLADFVRDAALAAAAR
jgi:hypothetical protein